VVYTASPKVDANLNMLIALRRLDCLGSYRGIHSGAGVVAVSGMRDVGVLREALSPYSAKMRGRLPPSSKQDVSGSSEWLPKRLVAKLFREPTETPTTGAHSTRRLASGLWLYEREEAAIDRKRSKE